MVDNNYGGADRREFFRYRYEKPIYYKVIASGKDKSIGTKLNDAISQNLSASGILFTSNYLPEISSLMIIDLDYRTTRICQEIEENALIVNDKLLGKVVRIEDNDDGKYNVGVAFIKKSDTLPNDVQNLIK